MTQKQRETLYQILGMIEGLMWGVENSGIAEGLGEVVDSLESFLQEDEQDEAQNS